MKKRILLMLLAIVMVVSLLPTVVLAASANVKIKIEGEGTATASPNPAEMGDKVTIYPVPGTGLAVYEITAKSERGFDVPITGPDANGNYTFEMPGWSSAHSTEVKVIFTQHVTSVSLNKSSLTLSQGDYKTLIPYFTPVSRVNENVTWHSDTPSVATVDNSGKVTAVGPGTKCVVTAVGGGTATITVTTEDGGYQATCNVTVKETYAITKTPPTNGTFTVKVSGREVTSAAAGETVTINVTPEEGYAVDTITVTKAGGGTVNVSGTGNSRTFNMPAEAVTVSATFKQIHKHLLCQTANCALDHNGSNAGAGHSDSDKVEFTAVSTEQQLKNAANTGGSVYLTGDIELTSTINVSTGKTLDLCLNGHKITPAQSFTDGRAVTVYGTFILTDCGTDGAITGFTDDGSGAGVLNLECFIMYGGSISGNTADLDGGGVYNDGIFTMYAGTISGNTAGYDGGGVYNCGTFTMYNGTISENIVDDDGSVVSVVNDGGGVFNFGAASIYGGFIVNNTAAENGGGLYHYHSAESLLLSGNPTISGNTVNNVDNNVCLDIPLTIDKDFAPTTAIGITMANKIGCFAKAAEGADIENIAVYEQHFASEGNYPIYTQRNVLCLGYTITEQPSADNYKVTINDDTNVTYQWGTASVETKPVVEEVQDSGGPNPCSIEAEVETIYVYAGTFDDGTWTTEEQSNGYHVLDIEFPVQKGDVIKFTPVGAVSGIEIEVYEYYSELPFVYDEVSGAYTYMATNTEYFNPVAETSDEVSFKIEVVRTVFEPLDIQNEVYKTATLYTNGLDTGTYTCQVTWDYLGTPDDTSDDYTLTSEPVEYTAPAPAPDYSDDYDPTYPVVENKGEDSNGTVKLSSNYSTPGSTVTVTVTPDKYYCVEKIIVRDASGKEIQTAKNADGTYSFKMPYSKVTVEAVYVWENPFVDVAEDTFYFDAVEWALKNDITEGTSETTFSPAAACTRAQMVTFLWRAAGCPEPTVKGCAFTDVDMDSYYSKAVLWAVENGITSGITATSFRPSMECSRAQMAAFLCRMANGAAKSAKSTFVDVADDAYYAESVRWAVENGITEGTGNNMFSPNATCTRGQMVTFLYRFYVK